MFKQQEPCQPKSRFNSICCLFVAQSRLSAATQFRKGSDNEQANRIAKEAGDTVAVVVDRLKGAVERARQVARHNGKRACSKLWIRT